MAAHMTIAQTAPAGQGWRRAVLGLFFASGISGLLYEVAWTRMLNLLFGDTVLAVSTVLTSFMAGLALGMLLVPTTLMGATLPVLSRYVVRAHATLGWRVGLLYALNTGGAVLGCLAAGYVLIGSVGLYETVAIGAALNGSVGVLAWVVRGRAGDGLPAAASAGEPNAAPGDDAGIIHLALWSVCLSGFAALSYEVIWTRALTFFIGNSTYAFSAMLTTFLFGLALGSLVCARLSDRRRNLLVLFGVLQLGIGMYALLTIPLLGKLFYGLDVWWDGFSSASWGTPVWLKFAKTFMVMLPPTFCLGGTFPLVSKIVARGPQGIGRSIGNIYALNTLGAIAGSWIAGFIFIPVLGLQKSLVATALLNTAMGGALLARG